MSDLPFGSALPSLRVAPPGPAAQALAQRLARVESQNVTFLGDGSEEVPIFWTEARGANVRDADANVYLDLTGAFGVSVAGHGHPAIRAALVAQGERLLHGMGDVHPPEIKVRLLERLAALSPWPETRGFLGNSGSEAVEAALKTAQLATGRWGVLAFEGGYHGLTLGALSITSREDFRAPFAPRIPPGVRFAEYPDALEADTLGRGRDEALASALASVEHHFREAAEQGIPIGAVVVEPIQGRGGVRVPVRGFLPALAKRVRELGAVLIYDEIFSGFGRTGHLFAFQAESEAEPDLLCVGKALGGGLPLSACLGRGEVMDAWPRSKGESLHTSTFLGHPLASASALAFLEVLEAEALVARARELGPQHKGGLEAGARGVGGVRGVGGRGMFLGVVLGGAHVPPQAGVRVADAALREGLIVLPAGPNGEVVELSPPLVLTVPQMEAAVEILVSVIGRVLRG